MKTNTLFRDTSYMVKIIMKSKKIEKMSGEGTMDVI